MAGDLGDFQTPAALVDAVLARAAALGPFERVLEPTCGQGRFIAGLLRTAHRPREIIGIERQSHHCGAAREVGAMAGPRTEVTILQADLFDVDLRALAWQSNGRLLVIGNPPWVTNADLGALGSSNRPARRRLPGLTGMAARTGESNFDLAEAVWLKVLEESATTGAVVALLCKRSTARRVLLLASRAGIGLDDTAVYGVSGRRWFNAQVDACLLVTRVTDEPLESLRVPVHADLEAREAATTWGLVDGDFVADVHAWERVRDLDGASPVEWRQGVKHDASAIMELTRRENELFNGLGERVDVEAEYRFPLLKATDLARGVWPPKREVIVTQRRLGDATDALAPRLQAYLERHGDRLDRRRSSIYRNRPRFSMFGVGDYTFAPFKVAVSGFHAAPAFRVVPPHEGRPVLLDDTGYFVACADARGAEELADLLSRDEVAAFFRALVFEDAKRPITKRVLKRLNVARLRPRSD